MDRYQWKLIQILEYVQMLFSPFSITQKGYCTGKSLSLALIFAPTNPQYDDILFIELQVQYMKIPSSNLGRTFCVQKLILTFRTSFVHNMFSPCSAKKKSFWQRFTCTGELIYFVASIVVLFNPELNKQRHYLGHTEEVKW